MLSIVTGSLDFAASQPAVYINLVPFFVCLFIVYLNSLLNFVFDTDNLWIMLAR